MKLKSFLERFGWNTAAQVTHIEWTRDADLIVRVDAYPFWLVQPPTERKRLTIRFNHVVESCIDLDWDELELDNLSTSTLDPLLWHYGQFATVYGSSPVPDPRAFLTAYLDKCAELGIVRDCLQYLNAETGLERWADVVRSSSYAILRAPIMICDAAQELLRRQEVRFAIVPGPTPDHARAREAVWIDTSWIICKDVDVDAEGA